MDEMAYLKQVRSESVRISRALKQAERGSVPLDIGLAIALGSAETVCRLIKAQAGGQIQLTAAPPESEQAHGTHEQVNPPSIGNPGRPRKRTREETVGSVVQAS